MKPAWLLILLCASLPAQVKITKGAGKVGVDIDGKPFTEFFIGPDTPKPYLHPLRSASGKIVTRQYPMENVPGESHDHPHHRGLWFTHGNVNGYDFWSNEPTQKGQKGKVVLKQIEQAKGGAKSGVIRAVFDWVDPKGKALLSEDRTMEFYSDPSLRTIDFDITLRALDTVKFGDTKEGTFAIRLAAGLEEPEKRSLPNPPRTGRMVDSEGRETEKNVWGKRANWVDYFGDLDGEKLGIAIFDHPGNPRHPTYWHSRAYGLFAANIFGVRDFTGDKTQDGSMTLEPGNTLRFRYRVLIHPGDYQTAHIAEAYKGYAAVLFDPRRLPK